MAEYIEREKLLSHLFNKQDEPLDVMREITEFPAADVAPVRHGKWIKQENYPGTYSKCSECDQRVGGYTPNYKYCPNCGARMDQEEEA